MEGRMLFLRVMLPVVLLLLAPPMRADEVVALKTLAAPAASRSVARSLGSPAGTPRPVPPRPPQRRQSFNDLVRNLVAAHEVQPLKSVLDVARKASAGDVVSIKLRRQKNRWIYHVRLLKPDGRRAELDIDGKSLKMLERR